MRKILISAFTIFAVLAAVGGATTAFFSDIESSTGNTLAAGSIDLKIDNASYYNGVLQDGSGGTPDLSWGLTDLTGELFLDFTDVKPGDHFLDTISVHVDNNDAWACAALTLASDADGTCTEPEYDVDPSCGTGVPTANGDLADELSFVWWWDNDGDGVWEVDETGVDGAFFGGFIGDGLNVGETAVATLADKDVNVFGTDGEVLAGATTKYIGTSWCFGNLLPAPLPEDSDLDPAARGGTGFVCEGQVATSNASQSDTAVIELAFYAEQARNNPNFTCSSWTP